MGNTNDKIKKICNFYASDWHFAVMLLPYINRQINEGIKITTVFEKNMENNIEVLLGKLNLKNKDEILQINWREKNDEEIKRNIEINLKDGEQNIFIINGNKDYIENMNSKIINYINERNSSNNLVKIIDCYEISDNKENVEEIIKNHDTILNTSGEQEIEKISK